MTRSWVGRQLRTASRPAYAPLLPTASQAAAERTTGCRRPADRAAVRLGLRTLVVAGFAGAAWLLGASAADAATAPAIDPTTDLPVVDLVSSSSVGATRTLRAVPDVTRTPVADATTAAHQPVAGIASASIVEPARSATAVVLPSATATRAIPLADAVRGVPDAVSTALTPATNAARTALTPATNAARTALAPVTTATRAVDNPLSTTTGALAPATGMPRTAAAPVTADVRPRSAVGGTGRSADQAGGVREADTASSWAAGTAAGLRPGLRKAARPAGRAGTDEVPNPTLPAPWRGQLGSGPGIPTTASGAPTEGGYAVVSPAVAADAVDSHRLVAATGTTVARQDAESPTVSPD